MAHSSLGGEMPDLTPGLAVEILSKILAELETPSNVKKIEEAKENMGNEMLKMMQFVFPVIMRIQLDVIKEYGYQYTKDGIIKFTQTIRNLEREDSEVARIHNLIRAYYLPPLTLSPPNQVVDATLDERAIANNN